MTIPWDKRNNDPYEQWARAKARANQHRAKVACAEIIEEVHAEKVFLRDKGICGICKEPLDPSNYTLDHIIPLSRGGNHTYNNIHVAHGICNSRKQNLTLEEYNAKRGI